MNHAKQPRALKLADRLEDFALALPAYGFDDRPPIDAAAELRRLHARVAILETQLIGMDSRRAEEKLRADQMTKQHRMQAAMNSEAREKLAKQAWDRGLKSPDCHCEACDIAANGGLRSRMSLCPQCGNKRCPRASSHSNACTASNALGQKGSSWENVKLAGEDLERDHSDEDAAIAAGKVQAAVQGRVG